MLPERGVGGDDLPVERRTLDEGRTCSALEVRGDVVPSESLLEPRGDDGACLIAERVEASRTKLPCDATTWRTTRWSRALVRPHLLSDRSFWFCVRRVSIRSSTSAAHGCPLPRTTSGQPPIFCKASR